MTDEREIIEVIALGSYSIPGKDADEPLYQRFYIECPSCLGRGLPHRTDMGQCPDCDGEGFAPWYAHTHWLVRRKGTEP